MKKLLLIIPLLMLFFSFTNPAHSYTWVKLDDYENGTIWYEPSTIEKDEGVSSVLIKTRTKEDENIVVWMVIDCEAKKYYLVGALLVDENDKALEFDDDQLEGDIIFEKESAAKDLYNMLCTKAVKKHLKREGWIRLRLFLSLNPVS